jgi:large subunit ribosomal protein L22
VCSILYYSLLHNGNVRSASYLNPLDWVKEKLSPAIREKQAKEEVEAGKQQAAEEGTQSVFETVPAPVRQKAVSKRTPTLGVSGIRKSTKPRPTLVCDLNL